MMNSADAKTALAKVPEVTLTFWILKVIATTVGETGGDAVSMSMNLGYLVSSGIFAGIFLIAVVAQVRANVFHPYLYWFTIVATTTVGTTLADFSDRSLHIGYPGGTALLFSLLLASLATWYWSAGTIAVQTVRSAKTELFYWVTIMFSQTLGTALGDWTSDSLSFGYGGGTLIFIGLLLVIAILYATTRISRTALFWSAFVLTRPLGAVVGDLLDKPISAGGFAINRYTISIALLILLTAGVAIFPQRPAKQEH